MGMDTDRPLQGGRKTYEKNKYFDLLYFSSRFIPVGNMFNCNYLSILICNIFTQHSSPDSFKKEKKKA